MKPERFGIGAAPRRKEDHALITGQGRYLADIAPEGLAHAVFVRSPVAHATFTLDNLEAARALPGVIAIYTAEDVIALGSQPCIGKIKNSDDSWPTVPDFPPLARDTVRFVGDAVAMVVAESAAEAADAADAIAIEFDDKPVVVDIKAALSGGPAIWPDLGGNVAFDADLGDKASTDAAFAKAERVISLELVNNRVVTNYMETRGCVAEYDTESGRYTLTASSQGVHLIQPILAEHILKIDPALIRVVTPHVGGGFGTKYFTYREYGLTLFAAEKLGRPVRWIASRSDHFVADHHGRDNISKAELAVDGDGTFLALKVDTLANMGAYLSQLGPFIPWIGAVMLAGCYRIPTAHVRLRGVYTNTVPVDAYRGAGRPEAAYLIERLVDKAALELGIAPDVLRDRNFITPDQMPYQTATGRTYDTGDFSALMHLALEGADRAGFDERAAQARTDGKLRGFGFASYIEACAAGSPEFARVVLDDTGGATIYIGTQSMGQGHDTAYSQLVNEKLGIPLDKVRTVQGDTDLIDRGYGTGGSRSIPVGGSSVAIASETLADRIRSKAADELEADPGDLDLVGGQVVVAGTDRAISLASIVADLDPQAREETEDWQPPEPTFPNGTHAIEVEIDKATGAIDIVNYVIVDDFGVVLNPIMLEGQIHGGVVQGIGQAMLEQTAYDDAGQLLTASFMDYCMPRADDSPVPEFMTRNIPCKTNALGMKGAGEAGSIGACPALVNAVVDALHRAYGITHVDMPMTPLAIWTAIQEGEAARG